MLKKLDLHTQSLLLIDWVNSIDLQSCALVNTLEDLKPGVIPLEILSYLQSCPIVIPFKLVKSRSQALSNWTQFLSELPDSLSSNSLPSSESILDKNQSLIDVLNLLSTLKREGKQGSPMQTKPTETSTNCGLPPKRPLMSPLIKQKFIPDSPAKTPNPGKAEEVEDKLKDLKSSIISYLEELDVIRPGTVDSDLLLNICRTGVLYADLVNRLEGKSEVVKGIERNPKNRTQALSNLNKTLEYLRSQEKMKSRYLWSGKEIVDGIEESICGLLSDIRSLYTRPKLITKSNKSQNESPSSSFLSKNEESPGLPESFLQEKSRALRSYSASMKRTPTHTPSASSSRVSRPNSSTTGRKPDPSSFSVSSEVKKMTLEWVEALGIVYLPTANPYTDTLKNGLLLAELVRVLEGDSVKVNPAPRSTKMIKDNFEKTVSIFTSKTALGQSFATSPKFLTENCEVVFAFIHSLMKFYPKAVSLEYQDHPLPYGALGIRRLEKSITRWVVSLNIIHPDPHDFHELVPEIKSGVLLCVIVAKVFAVKIPTIVKAPKTELSIMNNIRKALDVLRKMPSMSQKYLYSAKEIFKGCAGVTLGLLEDVHRCANGLPARKSGDDYYKDGPYLPREGKGTI